MWVKARNVFSEDAVDPLIERNLHSTNMLGTVWGAAINASSKEQNASEYILQDTLRTALKRLGRSGWLTRGMYSFSGGFPANSFHMASSDAYMSGCALHVAGTSFNSDTINQLNLSAPPGVGTRDDLVYLEMFLLEVPGSTQSAPTSVNKPTTSTVFKWGNVGYGGANIADDINEVNFEIRRRIQIQYRVRAVDGVDFATFPLGVDDPTVKAQGAIGNASPTAVVFAKDGNDSGLFVAGTGSLAHQATLQTLDGYVYAIPLARVLRTNGQPTVVSSDVIDLRTVWGGAQGRTSTVVTGDYQAQAGDRLLVDVSSGPLTVTLPPTPSQGDWLTMQHVAGNATTNNITVARNGKNIMALAQDMAIQISNLSVDMTYYNAAEGWRIG